MAKFMLDPVEGEKVGAVGHYGTFTVLQIYPDKSVPGLGSADLELVGTEFVVPRVPWSALIRPPEAVIQRVLDEKFASLGIEVPTDVQPDSFTVRAGETYDGDPKISISFTIMPGVPMTLERARELNQFSSRLQERLEPFAPNCMVSVFAKEQRELLSAAS